MDDKGEKERKEGKHPSPPQCSASFFPDVGIIVLISSCTGKLSSKPYENLKKEAPT
jgi:hypothetical protein